MADDESPFTWVEPRAEICAAVSCASCAVASAATWVAPKPDTWLADRLATCAAVSAEIPVPLIARTCVRAAKRGDLRRDQRGDAACAETSDLCGLQACQLTRTKAGDLGRCEHVELTGLQGSDLLCCQTLQLCPGQSGHDGCI